MTLTVFDMLARRGGELVALSTPGRCDQSYKGLRKQAQQTVALLNEIGVKRNDRVAIALPNGPDLAAAFVAVASGATAVPLNPASRQDEFSRYLSGLAASALVIARGSRSSVLAVAAERRIPIIELVSKPEAPSGTFELMAADTSRARTAPAHGGVAKPTDVCMVLSTSGTVTRPKVVPLSQSNVCASARHICAAFRLVENDSCLNIMPLFHVHGLVAAVLASLYAGARVICTPGFNALKFFSWLKETRPTWYTAAPAMHQAILARAKHNETIVRRSRLRFIRSASASLPPHVMTDLERTFGCPVIDSYALTEAATQVTANPLPPGNRKPGSVGPPAGPEVAVADAAGRIVPSGKEGEIVIRGPNVIRRYDNNPTADAECFIDGWLRTGDRGWFDEDNYLWITGRLKEMINRGGKKVSPFEVEAVLIEHTAVAQAVAFAIPHHSLGEDVAAAVVLREGATACASELRDFAADRLSGSKVPRKILLLDEIPKSSTGKIQRLGLAMKLGLC